MSPKLQSGYSKVESTFFYGLLLATLTVSFFLFKPYLSAILLAITLSVIFSPLNRFLRKRLQYYIPYRNGGIASSLAALITVVLVLILILGPLTAIGIQLFNEVRELYVSVNQQAGGKIFTKFLAEVERQLGFFAPGLTNNINGYIAEIFNWLRENIAPVVSGAGKAVITLGLSLLAFYYLLKDGEKLRKFVLDLSPLPDHDDQRIVKKLHEAVNSVIRGSVLIAIIKGVLAGVGFWIFGVPSPTLWGAFTAIAALVPMVGTTIVAIPAIAYLFITGDITATIGLTIWSATIVGLFDNIVGPILMKKQGLQMHPFIILLSVLGGISVFGPIGFLVGPLIVSFLLALLDIYAEIT